VVITTLIRSARARLDMARKALEKAMFSRTEGVRRGVLDDRGDRPLLEYLSIAIEATFARRIDPPSARRDRRFQIIAPDLA
jgi:hypothetical protein